MKKAVKRSLAVWSLVLAAGLAQAALAAIEPQRVIIDTDLGSSVDDLSATHPASSLNRWLFDAESGRRIPFWRYLQAEGRRELPGGNQKS